MPAVFCIACTVLRRSHAGLIPEDSGEVGAAAEPALGTDLADGPASVRQHGLGQRDPSLLQILHHRQSHGLPEAAGEMNSNAVTAAKYQCGPCGYVYDPEKGDPDSSIVPGTAFEDLPDDWSCPVCGVSKDMFEKI